MIPDIVVMGVTTDTLCDKESIVINKCEANKEPTLLKDIIGLQTFTNLERLVVKKEMTISTRPRSGTQSSLPAP